jgi:hypothetical protein
LSGYLPKSELESIQREDELQESYLLAKPSDKIVPPVQLIRSGLDAVIWFDTSRQECLRRAVGRRFDNLNEKMYHIQDSPPLTTNAPLCERLVPMEELENAEAVLIDKWISFDAHAPALSKWLE